MVHIPPILLPAEVASSLHVRSSSKPRDLCSTVELRGEVTAVALSTGTTGHGRKDKGEVEYGGL